MPAVSRRREIIERLLDHLPDYEPAPATRGGWGDNSSPRMPSIYWEPAVQELYRCLKCLRDDPAVLVVAEIPQAWVSGKRIHAELITYYHSEWRTVRPKPRQRILRGRVELVEPAPSTWKRERVFSRQMILPWVERGVVYIVETYRGEPFLPDQILKAA